jgi:ribosome modulation factor
MLIKPNIRKKRKQERDIQRGFQALVEGLSQRIMPIKSVGVKIVELEEQKEQLDNAALDVGLEIDATKAKVVSAQSSTKSLTTFEDFYPAALPEERRELIRLRVNQLIWTPEEIRLALLDGEEAAVTAVQREATVGSPDVGFN